MSRAPADMELSGDPDRPEGHEEAGGWGHSGDREEPGGRELSGGREEPGV
ncbi:MAG: hypothetical protein LBT40_04940 [Deltaproteobacteria bacterium]|nr:hypothetical protein [Deltaproteobacteria bacterium]